MRGQRLQRLQVLVWSHTSEHSSCNDIEESTPSPVAVRFGARMGLIAFTVSRISSRASKTCREELSKIRIDVEAWRRSRYRSLRFHDASEHSGRIIAKTITHPTMRRSSSCFASASVLHTDLNRRNAPVTQKAYAPEALLDHQNLRDTVPGEQVVWVYVSCVD